MTDYTLSICNKNVFEFYEKYSLDFEDTNILFCNLLSQIFSTTDNSYDQNTATIILKK